MYEIWIVEAYFEIALARISDLVPMFIQSKFFCGFSNDLRDNLESNLKLCGKEFNFEKIKEYTRNLTAEETRIRCETEQKLIQDALQVISTLEG
jgi:hypothetical protein